MQITGNAGIVGCRPQSSGQDARGEILLQTRGWPHWILAIPVATGFFHAGKHHERALLSLDQFQMQTSRHSPSMIAPAAMNVTVDPITGGRPFVY